MAENRNASAQSVNVDIFDGDSVRGGSRLTSSIMRTPCDRKRGSFRPRTQVTAEHGPRQRIGRLHGPEVVEVVETFEPTIGQSLGHQRGEGARPELADPAGADRHRDRDVAEAVEDMVGPGAAVDGGLGRAPALDADGAVWLWRRTRR